MNYNIRIANIITKCEEVGCLVKYQLNYGGSLGRHRIEVVTDSLLMTSIISYKNNEDEQLKKIETFLESIENEEE